MSAGIKVNAQADVVQAIADVCGNKADFCLLEIEGCGTGKAGKCVTLVEVFPKVEDRKNRDSKDYKGYQENVWSKVIKAASDRQGAKAPAYILAMVKYDTTDENLLKDEATKKLLDGCSGQRDKLALIAFNPAGVGVRDKMLFSATKEDLNKALPTPASKVVQATSVAEVSFLQMIKEVHTK